MADDSIKITHNSKEINKKLTELANRVKNTKPVLRKVGHVIRNYVDEKFETEGQYNGEKWQDWTPEYKKQRAKKKRGEAQILSLEGDLRKSIDDKVTSDSIEVGTNQPYAAIHNFGGEVKKRNGGSFDMPKRQYMAWEDKLIDLIGLEVFAELKLQNYIDEENARIKFLKGE